MGYSEIVIKKFMSDFSDKLRQLRGETSQAEMARQLGMKQPQWARYESGASYPSIEILTNICRTHCVSADWLLGLDSKSSGKVIASGLNSIAAGSNNQSVIIGEGRQCSKCPYKQKLKRLEKAFMKG